VHQALLWTVAYGQRNVRWCVREWPAGAIEPHAGWGTQELVRQASDAEVLHLHKSFEMRLRSIDAIDVPENIVHDLSVNWSAPLPHAMQTSPCAWRKRAIRRRCPSVYGRAGRLRSTCFRWCARTGS
jgi:hypothetical protein